VVGPPGWLQKLKLQLEAVLSAHVSRHDPTQVTLLHGNVEQSKLHVLNASQVDVQLPWPQVKAQVLPRAQ
jgi:hypothetical protein